MEEYLKLGKKMINLLYVAYFDGKEDGPVRRIGFYCDTYIYCKTIGLNIEFDVYPYSAEFGEGVISINRDGKIVKVSPSYSGLMELINSKGIEGGKREAKKGNNPPKKFLKSLDELLKSKGFVEQDNSGVYERVEVN